MSKVCKITGEKKCHCSDKPYSQIGGNKPDLKSLIRKLFTDHAIYTHRFVISYLNSLSDLKDVETRLLQNQKDIGNNLVSLIGIDSANKLIALLTEHILLAKQAVIDLKTNSNKLKDSIKNLFKNSDDIGTFLGSINPSILSPDIAKKEFKQHNQHVLNLATLRKESKYDKEITEYDAYYNHMLGLADAITNVLTYPKQQIGGAKYKKKNMTWKHLYKHAKKRLV